MSEVIGYSLSTRGRKTEKDENEYKPVFTVRQQWTSTYEINENYLSYDHEAGKPEVREASGGAREVFSRLLFKTGSHGTFQTMAISWMAS